MELKGYGLSGAGLVVDDFIVNQTTPNPNNVIAYNNAQPTVLPAATPNGPASFTLIKFSASSDGGAGAQGFNKDANWITFIGFYYFYRGLVQGETIPFIDLKTTAGYPGSC